MLSLIWPLKCDQQVEPPLPQQSGIPEQQLETKQKRGLPIQTVWGQREHLAHTVGHNKTWSHPHFRLSLLTWWEIQGKVCWDPNEAMQLMEAMRVVREANEECWREQERVQEEAKAKQERLQAEAWAEQELL